MGIKERRTKILLSLFLLSDNFFDFVKIDEKIQTIFDLSLNQKTKSTFSTLAKDLIIEQSSTSSENVTSNLHNESIYRLTDNGFKELSLIFPFFRFLKDDWDEKLRILSYEIPETKRDLRDKLRREVAGWGLGPWHRSFWITPHPIIDNLQALVSKKEEEKFIQAFEATHTFGDEEILIEKVWNKSTLEKHYRTLFKQWHEVLSKDEDKPSKLRQIVALYVRVLRNDPGLPKKLIGNNWIGFEAYNIFKEIRNILLG